ncbi:MAG: hypothetical protein QXY49_03810 [Thermofilaceae archaeon]
MAKGQVEVITALLMSVVLIAGFAVLWMWLYPSYMAWEQEAARTALKARAAAAEQAVLERIKPQGEALSLTVVNTGSIEVTVAAVYVNESMVWSGELKLPAGASSSLSLPSQGEGIYNVKLCTTRGNCWTFIEQVGSSTQPSSVTLTVGVSPPDGGRVTVRLPDGSEYLIPPTRVFVLPGGAQVTATAEPNPGYTFTHWTPSGDTNPTITFTITSPMTLTANFEITEYSLFAITDYTSSLSGTPGAQAQISVTVSNLASVGGRARVEVYDHTGSLIGNKLLSIPSSSSVSTLFNVNLPNQAGDYEWRVKVFNVEKGSYDDDKPIHVNVYVEPPKFNIVDYNATVTGLIGSKVRLVAILNNTGGQGGEVEVRVFDDGNLLNSTRVVIDKGSIKQVVLTVNLPPLKGVYAWSLKAYNVYTGGYDDSKTIQVTVIDLTRQSRTAFLYNSFESMPSDWVILGGSWSISGSGWKGSCLQGVDTSNAGGTPGLGIYYWQKSFRDYAPNAFQAIVKLGNVQPNDRVYRGYGLLEGTTTTTRLYELAVYVSSAANIQIRISRVTPTGRTNVASVTTGYVSQWYTLYLSYASSSSGNGFYLALYDRDGVLLTTLTRTDATFQPNYIALTTDRLNYISLFDELVVATSDPRIVSVKGLQQGWVVELWEGSVLRASGTAGTDGAVDLNVLQYPIINNGMFVIKDQQGREILRKVFDMVVGGDAYLCDP